MTYIPYLHLKEGDEAFVRSIVIEAASDFFTVRIENFPRYVFTAFAPVSEIAKASDIHLLNPMRLRDLKYLDPTYRGVSAQKLPK